MCIYRVFIKYCVFSLKCCDFLNSASSVAALVFYLPSVCTHTDTERKQIKARVRNILESSKKHNIQWTPSISPVTITRDQTLLWDVSHGYESVGHSYLIYETVGHIYPLDRSLACSFKCSLYKYSIFGKIKMSVIATCMHNCNIHKVKLFFCGRKYGQSYIYL